METFYYVCAAVLFFVVGVCAGSFSNVVIYRLPRGMSLAKPPSHCPVCDTRLSWKDNVPLFSFLFLRGKCRYCGAPISPRYFFVELLSGLLWEETFLLFFDQNPYLAAVRCIAVSVMICAGFCDEENLFLPDSLQFALAFAALAECALLPEEIWQRLLGAAVGGGFYLLFYLGSLFLFKREGLGFGDVKLMTAMGALLGAKKIFLAIVLGSLFALLRLPFDAGRRDGLEKEREYPLAPALVTAGVAVLLMGDLLLHCYASFFR